MCDHFTLYVIIQYYIIYFVAKIVWALGTGAPFRSFFLSSKSETGEESPNPTFVGSPITPITPLSTINLSFIMNIEVGIFGHIQSFQNYLLNSNFV